MEAFCDFVRDLRGVDGFDAEKVTQLEEDLKQCIAELNAPPTALARDQDLFYRGMRKRLEESQTATRSAIQATEAAQERLRHAGNASRSLELKWESFQDKFDQANDLLVYNIAKKLNPGRAIEMKAEMAEKQLAQEERENQRTAELAELGAAPLFSSNGSSRTTLPRLGELGSAQPKFLRQRPGECCRCPLGNKHGTAARCAIPQRETLEAGLAKVIGGRGCRPAVPSDPNPELDRLMVAITENIDEDFPAIGKAKAGEWLKEHEEVGQTAKAFISRAVGMNARPTAHSKTLYIQPLGTVGTSAKAKENLPPTVEALPPAEQAKILSTMSSITGDTAFLRNLKSFLSAFFLGMDVKVLKYKKMEVTARNHCETGEHQLHAGEVLQTHLPKVRMPLRDGFALLGCTMEDLYPRDAWNFVFGLADMLGRNGVFSFARYVPDETKHSSKRQTAYAEARVLKCAVKVMAHEFGHCFGLKHCIHFGCLMQGSNSAEEAGKKPAFLCPVCLSKLFFSLEFDCAERYAALATWCKVLVDSQETAEAKEAYAAVFGEWQGWYENRAKLIESKCPAGWSSNSK